MDDLGTVEAAADSEPDNPRKQAALYRVKSQKRDSTSVAKSLCSFCWMRMNPSPSFDASRIRNMHAIRNVLCTT